jgi:lipopolysaccharide transport system permease protein
MAIIERMIEQHKCIWQRRDLLWYLVVYNIKAEQKNKVLGFLWSFLDPLMLMVVYTVLVVFIFKRNEPQFPILIFSCILSWRWFIRSLSSSVTAITSKAKIVQATRFPLAILPLANVINGFVDYLAGFVVLVPLLFVFKASFSANILWLPLLLLIQFVGTIGAALICAVVGTYLSDLSNILQFGLRLWFYLSPAIWSVADTVPERFRQIYMSLNPFAALFESYKNILVKGVPPSEYTLVAMAMAIAVFILGSWYFARHEYKLVKEI